MWLRTAKRICLMLVVTGLVGWAAASARADDMCGACCQRFHCPPPLHHCMERPPRICWKCGCPKPICNPCDQPNWGYYQTCWTPWPWQPNWAHCPVPPPASMVTPGYPGVTESPGPGPATLPAPRPLRPGL
jgi:hypothetical protein